MQLWLYQFHLPKTHFSIQPLSQNSQLIYATDCPNLRHKYYKNKIICQINFIIIYLHAHSPQYLNKLSL